ncbi:MAG: nucleotide exchange factor GrpE [Spirochaetales bacterium]|jgi:molecular chaperone GrpE (heat shock protein)|nr:nucleotide exchange factor GrpE [Spirochaetales bacterium]
MLNFETELNKLLAREPEPLPHSELAELILAEQKLLAALNKKQADLSFQVEEIYDLAKESDTRVLQETLEAEKERGDKLAAAAIALCDILEHFCAYARQSGSEELENQARLLWQNSDGVLEGCGIIRLGEEGQSLDPEIHTVQAAAASPLPRERVTRVLQSGYRYLGTVLRRAAVVISTGPECPEEGDAENEQNSWY